MPSVETLGAVQYILVDKTGTLTQNSMRVKKIWHNNKEHLPSILKAAILGNTASLIQQAGDDFDIIGDKTDGALLLWAKEQAPHLEKELKEGKVTDEFVFESKTKTVTTVWEKNNKQYVFVRGAPESILERSRTSKNEKEQWENAFADFAKEGLRVIAFGSKSGNFGKATREEHEKDLTFLGFVGIYDPPREEVKHALKQARAAGIQTVMVTGDNELTALAIAKEIGLIENDEDVITGEELEKLKDEELLPLLTKTRIFARTRPHDKLRLATLFKKQGYVIGVTGDGVNDALALKKADVGVAMGESGTDVAKEASDIIIADDNFATIVKAIEEGRTIYHNIVKAITYLVSGNISELFLVFIATIVGLPSPLLPTQILWINLITDGFPALALASDPKNPHALKEQPRNPHLSILNRNRLLLTSSIGLGLALLLLALFSFLLHTTSEIIARTIVFNVLVASHMALAFLVRGRNALRPNKFLIITVLTTILLQAIITFTPFFHDIFEITSLF